MEHVKAERLTCCASSKDLIGDDEDGLPWTTSLTLHALPHPELESIHGDRLLTFRLMTSFYTTINAFV